MGNIADAALMGAKGNSSLENKKLIKILLMVLSNRKDLNF